MTDPASDRMESVASDPEPLFKIVGGDDVAGSAPSKLFYSVSVFVEGQGGNIVALRVRLATSSLPLPPIPPWADVHPLPQSGVHGDIGRRLDVDNVPHHGGHRQRVSGAIFRGSRGARTGE